MYELPIIINHSSIINGVSPVNPVKKQAILAPNAQAEAIVEVPPVPSEAEGSGLVLSVFILSGVEGVEGSALLRGTSHSGILAHGVAYATAAHVVSYFLRNTMKKSKSLFGRLNNEVRRNFTLRSSRAEEGRRTRQRPFTEARFEKRPCRRTPADQGTVSICVNL